jgi:hypothetical protein
MRWLKLGSVVGACLFAQACARRQSAGTAAAEVIHVDKQGGERVVSLDLNRDGKPDVFTYSLQTKKPDGTQTERLVRKELDINGDGLIDIRRVFDEQETLLRESLDLDFDGRVDQTNLYDHGTLVKKERDLDYNGKPDEWVLYEKGKIVRKERDANSDGRVDYWEYWENEAVDRVGEDLDGDGKVDRWSKAPGTTP